MMANNVGDLIREGMSTKDIQKQIKDFPSKFTTEYFENLGYEHIEAIRLKYMLRNNDHREKQEEDKERIKRDRAYIVSENADPNNVLVDTCAFQYQNGLDIINKSRKVMVIYPTICEMDGVVSEKKRKNKLNKNEEFLVCSIAQYAIQILIRKSKYHLIPYENKEIGYVDDKIIEYLKSIKSDYRPTLLTADRLLSLKAFCLGFETIFIIRDGENLNTSQEERSGENSDTSQKEQNEQDDEEDKKCISCETKKVGECKKIEEKKLNIYNAEVVYMPSEENIKIVVKDLDVKVFVVYSDGECKQIKSMATLDNSNIEYVTIVQKKGLKAQIVKIKAENGKISNVVKKCSTKSEIDEMNLHQKISKEAKKIVI